MAGFVRWSTDGSVSIERDFIILAKNFTLSLFLVNFHDVIKLNEAFVIDIQFRDEFAELKLFEVDFETLKNSFEIVNAYQTVSIVIQVFNTFPAVANVLLC